MRNPLSLRSFLAPTIVPKMDKKEIKLSLLESEWVIVVTLILIMLSMGVIAKINAYRSCSLLAEDPLPTHASCIVTIDGEVAKPGTFIVPPGTPLKKIIRKSCPTPFCDLKKIDVNQIVENSANIRLSKLSEITVILEGLSSGSRQLTIPAGTRMSQLKKYVDFEEESGVAAIKNRRMLRDGEVISIK